MDDRDKETKQSRVIFPCFLNDQGILFGGTAMQWMDEVAYITATRYSKMRMVTVSVEKVNFLLPVYCGKIVEIIGTIRKVKCVKLEIQVELFLEDMYTDARKKAMEAVFVFAAVDISHKPVPLKSSSQKTIVC